MIGFLRKLFGGARPTTALEWLERGLSYFDRGKYRPAIADFTEAIRLEREGQLAYLSRPLVVGDVTDTESIDRNLAFIYRRRADAYLQQNGFDQALADYIEAIRLYPPEPHAYVGRGNCYFEKREYDRAVADYTEAIRLHAQEPEWNVGMVYYYRSQAYAALGHVEQANADRERACQLDPSLREP